MRWFSRCAGALIAAVVGVVSLGAAPASSSWKLQEPGSSSITEVEPDQLDSYSSQWFKRTARGMVLTSPTEGATTRNSKHNRSELREMTGSSEASWNPAQGTHRLSTKLAVTKLPDTDPKVVVAQIHGGEDDIVTWYLDGKHLFVKVGDSMQPYATLTRNYRRGTPVTLGFDVAGGKIHATANGRSVATIDAPDDPGSYFKTGAYEQSPIQGDGVAQVALLGEPRAAHGGQMATPRRQRGAVTPVPRQSGNASCSRMPGPLQGRPGAATTGVPAGVKLRRPNAADKGITHTGGGNYTATSNIVGLAIPGTLTVAGRNVSVSCSRIGSMIENKGTGTKIWLTTIGGPRGMGGPAGIRNSDFTARRVEIFGTTDGIRTTGPNVDVRDSWIHGLYDDGAAHNDGMQVSTGSSEVTFVNNLVDSTKTGSGGYQTSGIILFNEDAPVTIVGNAFTGRASTHINAVKIGGSTRVARNVFTKSSRDAVTKGLS